MRSSRLRALAVALAWLAAAALPARAQAAARVELVERILAVVDERPLLLSDVRTLAAVRGLDEAAALEAAIDERLMYLEAARLPQAEVSADEEQRAVERLLEERPALSAEVSDAHLRRLAHRQIAILKYVEFRFRPQLRVSDEEVRAAFEAEPLAAGATFESEKERVRDRLERQALGERVEAWVRELRARADVRYVGRAATAGGP